MALKFQLLKVKRIERETPDAVTIHFENPDQEIYQYIPGQYLTLKVRVNDKPYNRAYSLCSCPALDSDLAVTVKVTPGGMVSPYLNSQLKEGDTLEVLPPMGNFVAKINARNQKHYVLIGAGSGITPLMSILRTVLEKEAGSKVTLLYGNRSEDSVIFRKRLAEIRTRYPDRFTLIQTLSQPEGNWEGLKGRISEELVEDVVNTVNEQDNLPKEYFICGPSGMMDLAGRTLKKLGINKEQVHEEHFSAPVTHPMEEDTGPIEVAAGQEGKWEVKIILDDEEHIIDVEEGQSVLDAALDADLDPPYACMIGSCCTCKGKLISGKVTMDDREGLTDAEIADGYVLTCQSHPQTPGVVISYDDV